MELSVLIIMVALLQYSWFTLKVGVSRPKFEVTAPNISGEKTWERLFRVQQNTLEQLIIYIPSLLAFTYYVSAKWAFIPGVIFIIGRQLYAMAYVNDPSKRTIGFALTFFSNMALVLITAGFIVGQLLYK
ncbi:MAPEG family protein [Psychrosphaera sp. 1_MG-2023]|uniref:MAPEG family protein n=1 Tax=Psychrosphaera sp. 1_MG-2023 TaxID=3062643 RepID=UPI0026E3A79C|nr:MAPEG family protein [Psychrosphaera sp. 1_MG-2023]MDO6721277.1 MAPEG family protein [Psychrosphaera sp. 1_MG-2023]